MMFKKYDLFFFSGSVTNVHQLSSDHTIKLDKKINKKQQEPLPQYGPHAIVFVTVRGNNN